MKIKFLIQNHSGLPFALAAFIVAFLITLLSCKKQVSVDQDETTNSKVEKIFSIATITNSNIKAFATETYHLDKQLGFSAEFLKTEGIILWNDAEKFDFAEGTIFLIPFAVDGKNEAAGFVRFRKTNGGKITYAIYRKDLLVTYGFSENSKRWNVFKVQGFINHFDQKLFDKSSFTLVDRRQLSKDAWNRMPVGATVTNILLRFKANNSSATSLRQICYTEYEDIEVWYCPNGEGVEGHSCGEDEYQYTYTETREVCYDSGGDDEGTPPYGGGGGSSDPYYEPVTFNGVTYTTNNYPGINEGYPWKWWEDSSPNSDGGVDFGTWAINYLSLNYTVPFSVFQNQFMTNLEGQDDTYDAAYWDDPSNTFPRQALPSWTTFEAAFPKRSDPLYNTSEKFYSFIGGAVLAKVGGTGIGVNTCATRVSKALNYSGITIPHIPGKTFQGSDGKYYFLGAENLNKWMRRTFGCANPNTTIGEYLNNNSLHYNSNQIGTNGANMPSLLSGIQGIYSMVSNNYNWATGHADLMTSIPTCDGGCHFDGPVKFIDVWKLQ